MNLFHHSLHYDPMFAKLCTRGRNRESAISNMRRALREYKILGIKTTIPSKSSVVGRQMITAQMPGVILMVYVKPGEEVKAGDPLCVLVVE